MEPRKRSDTQANAKPLGALAKKGKNNTALSTLKTKEQDNNLANAVRRSLFFDGEGGIRNFLSPEGK